MYEPAFGYSLEQDPLSAARATFGLQGGVCWGLAERRDASFEPTECGGAQETCMLAAIHRMVSTTEADERSRALTFCLSGDFRGRTQLNKVIRQAVTGLLIEAGCDREAQGAGMIVAQELAENLVKYSRTARTSFAATVRRLDHNRAELQLETANDSSADEVARVQSLLAEIARIDPSSLYQERIASSSARTRSELGLLRIVAEAAMGLRLSVDGERVHFSAQSGPLNVSMNASGGPRNQTIQHKGESR